eukprot:jgi/Ulvmu1/4908/UM020_0194.1
MGNPGRPLPSQAKSTWLIEDARQMEDKLAELRLRLADERHERQRRLQAGRVWASSHTPRPVVSKHHIAGRGNITLESSLRQVPANRFLALDSCAPSSNSHAKVTQLVRSCWEGASRQDHTPYKPEAGQHLDNSKSLAAGVFDENESRRSFLAALDDWRGTSNHSHHMPVVDAASATANNSDRVADVKSAHEPGTSVFQRILLRHAMQKAGHVAATECQCHATESKCHTSPLLRSFSVTVLGMESTVECDDDSTAGSTTGQTGHHHPIKQLDGNDVHDVHEPCAGRIQDESVVVVSVTDVNPHQALTSRIRFPDAIILPNQ